MTERQPLLLQSENTASEERYPPRPDVRNSPENTLVNVQSEESIGSLRLLIFILCYNFLILNRRLK